MSHKLCKILGIKLWETYDKVSDVFAEPKLHFKVGRWRKDPCLPIWRRGPIISFGKYSGKSLPMCFAFYIFNLDVMWKTKWDEIRYEYPPQFTVVLFGISFSWWLSAPSASTDWKGQPDNGSYWETILEYVYGEQSQDENDNLHNLKRCIDCYYFHTEYTDEENKKFDELTEKMKAVGHESPEYGKLLEERSKLGIRINTIACRPEYLQSKYLGVFYDVISDFRAKHSDEQNWIFV